MRYYLSGVADRADARLLLEMGIPNILIDPFQFYQIGLDVVRQFPHGLRRLVGLVAVLCCCAYCIILLVGAVGYVHKLYTIGIEAQDLPIPRWIPFIMLPLGLALALLRLLQVAWHTVLGRQEGLRLADEAREAIEAAAADGEVIEAVETFEDLHPTARTDKKEKAP